MDTLLQLLHDSLLQDTHEILSCLLIVDIKLIAKGSSLLGSTHQVLRGHWLLLVYTISPSQSFSVKQWTGISNANQLNWGYM